MKVQASGANKKVEIVTYKAADGTEAIEQNEIATPDLQVASTSLTAFPLFEVPTAQWNFPTPLRVSEIGPLKFSLSSPLQITKAVGKIVIERNTGWDLSAIATGGEAVCLWNGVAAHSCTLATGSITIVAPTNVDIAAATSYEVIVTTINADDPDENGITMHSAAGDYELTLKIDPDGDGNADYQATGKVTFAVATKFKTAAVDYGHQSKGLENLLSIKVKTQTATTTGQSAILVKLPTMDSYGNKVFDDDLGYGANYPDNAIIPCDIVPSNAGNSCKLKHGNSSPDSPATIVALLGTTVPADQDLVVTFMLTNPTTHTNNNIIIDVTVETYDNYLVTPVMTDSAFLPNIFTVLDEQGASNYVSATTLTWDSSPTTFGAATLSLTAFGTTLSVNTAPCACATTAKILMEFPSNYSVDGATVTNGIVYPGLNAIMWTDQSANVSPPDNLAFATDKITYDPTTSAVAKTHLWEPDNFGNHVTTGTPVEHTIDSIDPFATTTTPFTLTQCTGCEDSKAVYMWHIFTITPDKNIPAAGCVSFTLDTVNDWVIGLGYCEIVFIDPMTLTPKTSDDSFECSVNSGTGAVLIKGFTADLTGGSAFKVRVFAKNKKGDGTAAIPDIFFKSLYDGSCNNPHEKYDTAGAFVPDGSSLGTDTFYFGRQSKITVPAIKGDLVGLVFHFTPTIDYTFADNTYIEIIPEINWESPNANQEYRCEFQTDNATTSGWPAARIPCTASYTPSKITL